MRAYRVLQIAEGEAKINSMSENGKILNIVMLVHNRPRLTRQALESLEQNTVGTWNLTVVDDNSNWETMQMLTQWMTDRQWADHLYLHQIFPTLGPGRARNEGIKASERIFERSDLLYLCDNDFYALPGWDQILVNAFLEAEKHRFKVLAGYCHPYNQTVRSYQTEAGTIHEKQAIGLLSTLMRWETYDMYGPYDPSPSINGSEDFAFCQKVKADGFKVGCVWPWVILNCGLTGSNGKYSPGAELIHEQNFPSGVIVE